MGSPPQPAAHTDPVAHASEPAVLAEITHGVLKTDNPRQQVHPYREQDFHCAFARHGGAVVEPFYFQPVLRTPASLYTIVNGEEKQPAGKHQGGSVAYRLPHAARVVERAPGVYQVRRIE